MERTKVSSNQDIKAIVFDLGGVLFDWSPYYLYRKILHSDLEIERFLKKINHDHWNSKQDAGRPFYEAIAELTQKFPEDKHLIECYFGRWPEMLKGPIEATVELLQELHASKNFSLFALSNWSAETFTFVRDHAFLMAFKKIYLSAHYGLTKPDPGFYEILLTEQGLDPQACLFIDDNSKNILAANRLGFKTHRFHCAHKLREQLKSLL